MTRPLLSFVSTAYRTEPYVAAMIESVRAQTRGDWELVVVDNGPSDELAEIVGRYLHDPRITLVRQENRGISGGVNAGAAAATGRYLVPLDSDDEVMPEYCARMGGLLEQHPEIDVLACDAYMFTGDTVYPRSYLRAAGARRRARLRRRLTVADVIADVVPFYVGVVRRELWDAAGGFCSDPPDVEDLILWLRVLVAGADMRMIPDRLARYRIREDSISRGPSSATRQQASREQVCTAAAEATGSPRDLAALRSGLRHTRYVQAMRRARWAFMDGDVATARAEVGAAFRLRRTLRSAGVLTVLTLAPGVARRIHPAKRRVSRRLAVGFGRLVGVDRRAFRTGGRT